LVFSAVSRSIRARNALLPVFTRALETLGRRFPPSGRTSGALLPEAHSLGDQRGQAHQVVGCATEDEQPFDVVQTAQLHLADRSGLLEPSKSLFDQPSAAQADGVTGMPRGSAVEVRAASLLVLGHMCDDVQLACGRDEILRVVGLGCSDRRIYSWSHRCRCIAEYGKEHSDEYPTPCPDPQLRLLPAQPSL
jgi:hypothetical protein